MFDDFQGATAAILIAVNSFEVRDAECIGAKSGKLVAQEVFFSRDTDHQRLSLLLEERTLNGKCPRTMVRIIGVEDVKPDISILVIFATKYDIVVAFEMACRQVFPAMLRVDRNDVLETVLVKVIEIPADIIAGRTDDVNVYTEPIEVVFQDQKERATSLENNRGAVVYQCFQK